VPFDFAKLRQENIRKYGEDVAHLRIYEQLYSERSHFVLELVQNAEDAGASWIKFDLFPDRLEVRHDGRAFNNQDVESICSIGDSSKSDDLTQIGKFGLGFKSVYAYTSKPEVHYADLHFEIRDYVRPFELERMTLPEGETLFVLPFTRALESDASAFDELRPYAESFDSINLLFLTQIQRISWQIENQMIVVERTSKPHGANCKLIELRRNSKVAHAWLIFTSDTELDDGRNCMLKLAFEWGIVSHEGAPLVVFFPTQKEMHCGFLLHGPFRTTPARDNVPSDNSDNQQLMAHAGRFLIETLANLRDLGLLDAEVLAALPIVPQYFQPRTLFHPLYNHVLSAFADTALLPTAYDSFEQASRIKIAANGALRELLSSDQLTVMLGGGATKYWLHEDITADKFGTLYRYLNKQIKVEEITTSRFFSSLDTDFLEAQSDEWLSSFYEFCISQKGYWNTLKNKPIVRLEDGTHVQPFSRSAPNAYLSKGNVSGGLPLLSSSFSSDPSVRAFLIQLGVPEADAVCEAFEHIIPLYESEDVVQAELHARNVVALLDALDTDSAAARQRLSDRLSKTAFAKAINLSTGAVAFKTPSELYFANDDLRAFFEGTDNWCLNEEQGTADKWLSLGVKDFPIRLRYPDELTPTRKLEIRGVASFSDDKVDDYDLDGLDSFLDRIGHADLEQKRGLGKSLWKLLAQKLNALSIYEQQKLVNAEYRWKGSVAWQPVKKFDAKWIRRLQTTAWIPTKDGDIRMPSEIAFEEAAPELETCAVLVERLKFKTPELDALARQTGLDAATLQIVLSHPKELAQFVGVIRQREQQTVQDEAKNDPSVVPVKFAERFRVPEKTEAEADNTDDDVASDGPPDLGEPLKVQMELEPPIAARFERILRKDWEKRPSKVREFLLHEYGGKCQVCQDTFLKRDQSPYFEAMYIVSRTIARWVEGPGNVFCLCATCCAKFRFGTVEAEDILEQIRRCKVIDGFAELKTMLCKEEATIRLTAAHLNELRELLVLSDNYFCRFGKST
jgi:hypothetical protein